MTRIDLSNRTRIQALADYHDGMPYKQILSKNGISRTTLYRWLMTAGVPRHYPNRGKRIMVDIKLK